MSAITTRRFASPDELTQATAALLAEEAGQGHGGQPRAIMLSGGRTPLEAYRTVANRPRKPAGNLHVLLSDERMVPEDSPESNLGNAGPLIAAFDIPEERIIKVHTALSLDEAAARYHSDIERFLERGGRIPLGLLGLGSDGHTASLFSPGDVVRGEGKWAVAVAKAEGPSRISVTPALLSRVERIVFLAAGSEKAEIAAQFCQEPRSIVAGLAVSGCEAVELWLAG